MIDSIKNPIFIELIPHDMKKFFITLSILFGINSLHAQDFEVQLFAQGLSSPVEITHAGDDRLFVVQQGGQIRIVNPDGTLVSQPFLNISSIISSGGERGLLGLAFAPDYETSGRFYVNYTNTSGHTVIARYTVSENPNVANPNGEILLTINQPFSNHNGGTIKFGPDGYLWISMGDGGSGGDPNNNGQNINTKLGKMLRIDVSGNTSYTSPSDNPFVGTTGEDEIWSYGLRNAWKFSFDRETNEVWIADVGQNQIEEINKMPYDEAGLNYGWRCYEGNNAYNTTGCAAADTMVFPVATYNHSSGRCSLTGGYVYRGNLYPNLQGVYFFGDYCSGEIGTIVDNQLQFVTSVPNTFITTFGEDANGELYFAGSGRIYKIIGEEVAAVSDFNKFEVSVTPNPVQNYLNVHSKQKIDEVSIYSLEGKLIKTVKDKFDQINVSSFPQGVYILNVHSGKTIKTQKVIKN